MPNSARSQFFIITGPDGPAALPPGLTVFGGSIDDDSLRTAQEIEPPRRGDRWDVVPQNPGWAPRQLTDTSAPA